MALIGALSHFGPQGYSFVMSFWPTKEHWSVEIPVRTNHYICPAVESEGFVALAPFDQPIDAQEWEQLEYLNWKSGGDTNFAPLASADGQLDCRGFWDKGKTDKDALWTSNAALAPTLQRYVDSIGANFGRVRIIKLEPQDGLFGPGSNSPTTPTATCC